jgi:hypothetical protein
MMDVGVVGCSREDYYFLTLIGRGKKGVFIGSIGSDQLFLFPFFVFSQNSPARCLGGLSDLRPVFAKLAMILFFGAIFLSIFLAVVQKISTK